MLSTTVTRLHDNAHPYIATHTEQTLQHLHSEVLEHVTYSPDLELSDNRLFEPLKNALWDRHFASDHEVKEASANMSSHVTEKKNSPLKAHRSLCNFGSSVLKSRGTVLKIMYLQVTYCFFYNFNNYIVDTF